MMMDNAAVCSGPQIIMQKGKVVPQDKNYTLYARKVWLFTGEETEVDVRKVFTTVEISSHQAELAAIIDLGVKLADAETSVPMITQGEQGNAPDTVGGMQMLMNSANVVLRRLVKQFDDYITKRHIRRYYDYNMEHNDKAEIKGDMSVDARGSSALLVRDIQNQAFMTLLAAGANPVYEVYIDTKKLFEKALAAQHVQPQDVMKSDEEIETEIKRRQENPPQDPRIQAATITAQSRVAAEKARADGYLSEIQLRKEIADQNHQFNVAKLELTREIEAYKLAMDQKISLDEAKLQLATTTMDNQTKQQMQLREAAIKEKEGSGL
jgi:hypothetical protein